MRRVVLAALALVLLSGCRVGVTVGIEGSADGSGRVRAVVTLDEDAARRTPDLADELEIDDLRAAGWEVTGPRPSPDGGVVVEAVKRYRSPSEATQVVEELTGGSGPFHDVRLRRTRSFLKTRTTFEGTVDLSGGLAAFADEGLRARLGGSGLGFDPAELERGLGRPLDEAFDIRVVARLPGDVQATNAPERTGGGAAWEPSLGEHVQLSARAEHWNLRNVGAATLSLVSGVAAVVLAVRRLRHHR